MKKGITSKPRLLTEQELLKIQKRLHEVWKKESTNISWGSFHDMVYEAKLPEEIYGRYASAETSSLLIVQAARFISTLSANYNPHRGIPGRAPAEIAEIHYELVRDKVMSFDHKFFECVSVLLEHLESGGKIADIEWRKMRKFSPLNSKVKQGRAKPFDLKNAVDNAVFCTLLKRVKLKDFPNHKPSNLHAVMRQELRMALKQSQIELGAPEANLISESDLSRCLTETESGRFIAQFMAEMPIATKARKMQN